jgi:hypothetical protein
LLVLNASPVAPVLLAGPREMFELDDPAAGSSALIERARRALDAEHRSLPGPLLPVPFDVLALALGRDLERDATEPDLAVREVEDAAGLVDGQLYRILMGDVEGSMSIRRLDAAMNAFWSISSPEDLERAVTEHTELVGKEARERLRSIIAQATAADDGVGVALANAQLALLERCAEGQIAEGFAEYLDEAGYSELVDPQLRELWDRLAEAREHDPAHAVSIGEALIELSARFHRWRQRRQLPMTRRASTGTTPAGIGSERSSAPSSFLSVPSSSASASRAGASRPAVGRDAKPGRGRRRSRSR